MIDKEVSTINLQEDVYKTFLDQPIESYKLQSNDEPLVEDVTDLTDDMVGYRCVIM